MDAKFSRFVIDVEEIIYFVLYNLHECFFKSAQLFIQRCSKDILQKIYVK